MTSALSVTANRRSSSSTRSAISASSSFVLAMLSKIREGYDRNPWGTGRPTIFGSPASSTEEPRRRGQAAVATVLAAALTVAGCGGSEPEGAPATTSTTVPSTAPVTIALSYRFTAGDGSGIWRPNEEVGGTCGIHSLTDGNDTLRYMEPGSDAILADASGDIVAKSTLSNGAMLSLSTDGNSGWRCGWFIEFEEVPLSDFYTLTVNGTEVETLDATDLVDVDGTLTGAVIL